MLRPREAFNGLLVAKRRGRLDGPRRRRLVGFPHALPIILDTETAPQMWTATQRLAERFGLSSYDAAYLSWPDVGNCRSRRLIAICDRRPRRSGLRSSGAGHEDRQVEYRVAPQFGFPLWESLAGRSQRQVGLRWFAPKEVLRYRANHLPLFPT
jgi:hypothetical protein